MPTNDPEPTEANDWSDAETEDTGYTAPSIDTDADWRGERDLTEK